MKKDSYLSFDAVKSGIEVYEYILQRSIFSYIEKEDGWYVTNGLDLTTGPFTKSEASYVAVEANEIGEAIRHIVKKQALKKMQYELDFNKSNNPITYNPYELLTKLERETVNTYHPPGQRDMRFSTGNTGGPGIGRTDDGIYSKDYNNNNKRK